MNFICLKNVLLDNIIIASRAVASRTTNPILECLLLEADDDGLKITGNDLELAIQTSNINCEVNQSGKIALDSKLFLEIIRKMPDDYINIFIDKSVIHIQCANVEFNIAAIDASSFPSLPDVEKSYRYNLDPTSFKNVVKQTIFSVSIDDSKPALTGELLEIKDGFLNVVAVDGFRVSFRKVDCPDSHDAYVVVPARTLSEIIKIIPPDGVDLLNMFFTDKHIVFEFNNCTVVSRILDGDFINYDQVLNDDYSTIITVDRLSLLLALERVSLISNKEVKKYPVKLIISDGSLILTSQTQLGIAKDQIPIDVDGGALEISYNPKFILDAIRALDEDVVTMQFTNSFGPCIIKGLGNQNAKYFILPLRTRD